MPPVVALSIIRCYSNNYCYYADGLHYLILPPFRSGVIVALLQQIQYMVWLLLDSNRFKTKCDCCSTLTDSKCGVILV
jgi:hypothetical protein